MLSCYMAFASISWSSDISPNPYAAAAAAGGASSALASSPWLLSPSAGLAPATGVSSTGKDVKITELTIVHV